MQRKFETHRITDSIILCKYSSVFFGRGCQVFLLLDATFIRFRLIDFACPVAGNTRESNQYRSLQFYLKMILI